MKDPEIVELRKFCGGLAAQLDQQTGPDAPIAVSELAKVGFEEGFTLYDTPPEIPFKQFSRRMNGGRTMQRGWMSINQAKDKCLANPQCKGISTSEMLFGLVGKATNDKKRWVTLKDDW